MSRDFALPDLGEGVVEGQIVRVLVAEGDEVREDQPLMEVETDKASVEIPSPHTGRVLRVHVTEQQVVNVGDVMVTFSGGSGGFGGGEGDGAAATPAVSTASSPANAAAPAIARAAGTGPGSGRKPASPAVRKLARSLGIDINTVTGSGPGGRVSRDDVQRAAAGGAPATPPGPGSRPAPTPVPGGAPGSDTWGPTERVPMTRARKAIAEAMILSVSTVPHATDTDDADVTDLDRLRRGYTERKLSILPFVVRATVIALQKYPTFNASYDAGNEQIVYHKYISIAIGVHTERGLIAPVVRNVDQQSIPQIADELARLAEKARTASFEVNDTRGGTFTLSNAGAVGGSRYSTPIINPPQAAIMALGRTRWHPWVVDGTIVPRLILPLSMSFDHRLIDGADEVHFMREVIELLENPARLML